MRRFAVLLLVCISSVGCQGGGDSPLQPASVPNGSAGPSPTGTLLAEYTVAVDLTTLQATVDMLPTRGATQSELYNLQVDRFLKPGSFRATAIWRDDSSLFFTYEMAHPFPVPANLAGPATAGNRADLAATGRVLWLVDNPDLETYFAGTDDVRANTRMVRNPDGYFTPGDLIGSSSLATTFPYQLLVDEARDNRQGLSNNELATGNYGPAGWQSAEFTSGITGYDIWSQGQTSINTLELDIAEIGSSDVFIANVAIIVKYEDPRGGADILAKRANRLPTGDVLAFGYRMPHGALDVGKVSVQPMGAILGGTSGTIGLAAHVRDWDARATEAAQTNLAAETNPALVSDGESGLPELTADIPLLTGIGGTSLTLNDNDAAFGGDSAEDSGAARDELFYTGTLTGTPSATGILTGLVRATDVVDITPPADWLANRIDLAPDLTPLGTGHEGSTYQAFTVEVLDAASGAWQRIETWGGGAQDEAHGVAVDSLGNTYITGYYSGTVDFDPGVDTAERTAVAGNDAFVLALDPVGAFRWVAPYGGGFADVGSAITVDADGNCYIVGNFSDTADFDPGAADVSRTSLGNSDCYLLSLNPAGDFRWVAAWGSPGTESGDGVTVDLNGNVAATGVFHQTVDFDPSGGVVERTSAGSWDVYLVSFTQSGDFRWVGSWGSSGWDKGSAVASDADGDLYVTGAFEFTVDFNPGLGIAERTAAGSWDSYLASYTRDGALRMVRSWGGGPSDEGFDVAVDGAGNSFITGYFGGLADFDPSAFKANRTGGGFDDGYLLALNRFGDYRWVAHLSGSSSEVGYGVAIDQFGRAYVAGDFNGTTDFDPGPGVQNRTVMGEFDGFLLALNAHGGYRWVGTWGGAAQSDVAYDVAATPLGITHTTGYFHDTVDFDPGPGVVDRTSAGLRDAYLLTLGP